MVSGNGSSSTGPRIGSYERLSQELSEGSQFIELQRLDTEKLNDEGSNDSSEDSDDANTGLKRSRTGSASTTRSFQLYTPDEEAAVVKKFDRRLVLFVALLYMLSFLDRSSRFPTCFDDK